MIYLDNAATTFPKPMSVRNAVVNSISNYGANPGRGGHDLAVRASEIIYKSRSKTADFFGEKDAENVIFTSGCTHSINIVLKGLLKPGDHVVVSDIEHNAVMRPLYALKKKKISYSVARVSDVSSDETLENFRNALQENTRLVVCTHVSNVWGTRLPVERITAMCHQYSIPVLIDAAQSAGVLGIDLDESNFDYICMPVHKGLYGPMGTGILITKHHDDLDTLIEGGTGSNSALFEQPGTSPDKFESGTPNLSGIAGLGAGIDFVRSVSCEKIHAHEINLLAHLYDRLEKNKNIILYTPRPNVYNSGGVLSFNVKNHDSEEVAAVLYRRFSIFVRAGLHCSPLAHLHHSTEETGAVRIAPSYFNTISEMNVLAASLKKI